MDQLANVLWAIDKAHIVPQRALDRGPGLGGSRWIGNNDQ